MDKKIIAFIGLGAMGSNSARLLVQAGFRRLRELTLRGKTVIRPDPGMVQSYHAPVAYLDQMEAAFPDLSIA